MTLDDVDIQVMLLDRLAEARAEARRRAGGGTESVEDAIRGAMGEEQP